MLLHELKVHVQETRRVSMITYEKDTKKMSRLACWSGGGTQIMIKYNKHISKAGKGLGIDFMPWSEVCH